VWKYGHISVRVVILITVTVMQETAENFQEYPGIVFMGYVGGVHGST